MIELPGYIVQEQIYKGRRSLVYRGVRTFDQYPVIFKLMANAYPSTSELSRFRREYRILRHFKSDRIVRVYDLLSYEKQLCIVMEDFGGCSLAATLKLGALTLIESLDVVSQVAEILGEVHQNGIIHKDVTPSNIIWNREMNRVKLIDFGISSELVREVQSFQNPHMLAGTLAYISPEQTGRMNRAIDYRTDYYSLGVTFYQLLTNQLPFASLEPMEQIHAHIARQPVAPHLLNPNIPLAVSQIVLKLMNKESEDRYQSALGIVADLKYCLTHWSQLDEQPFVVGRVDVPDHLVLSERLYGREMEIAQLEHLFERIQIGSAKLGLIRGPAGVGKTSLVKELYHVITREQGGFLEGKYDQFKRDVPYHGLIQAFEQLIDQILREDEVTYTRWRVRLQKALGQVGQVLVFLMPRLALLIGEQPTLPKLGPLETQNRLNYVFGEFVNCFLSEGYPLVIFLDDLQWVDSSSLVLLERLINDVRFKGLLILGAYRNNVIMNGLHHLLQALTKMGKTVKIIDLAPLSVEVVAIWLGEIFKQTECDIGLLARLLYKKSQGNPFFVRELLKRLYDLGHLYLDHEKQQWVWEIEAIEQLDLSDNVVIFLMERLRQLPITTQRLLQYAACIGNQFELSLLSKVLESSIVEMMEGLMIAIRSEIVVPVNEGNGYDRRGLAESRYRFAHDRIQQAAYELLPEVERTQVHWQIGKLLAAQLAEEPDSEALLMTVNQLNAGTSLLVTDEDLTELARLNYEAGERVRVSGAFEVMYEYMSFGLALVTAADWDSEYQLLFDLHLAGAESAYLTGHFAQTKALVEAALSQTASTIDIARLQFVQMKAYNLQNKFTETIRLGLSVLNMLGLDIPNEPTEQDVVNIMEETRALWQGKAIESLADLPSTDDPQQLMVISVFSELVAPVFITTTNLRVLIACQWVGWSIRHGNSAVGVYSYMVYGILMTASDISAAYAFGQVGLRLLDVYAAQEVTAKVLFIMGASIEHWCRSFSDSLTLLSLARQRGLENGDFEYAGYASGAYAYRSYVAGKELMIVEQECGEAYTQLGQLANEAGVAYNGLTWQAVLNLRQTVVFPAQFHGPVVDERVKVPLWEAAGDGVALSFLYNHKFILGYLFAYYDEAIEVLLPQVKRYIAYPVGYAWVAIVSFYEALLYLAVYDQASVETQRLYLHNVDEIEAKLSHWARHAPMNYQHKCDLMAAERLRVIEAYWQAGEMYDRAIAGARTNGFQQEAALANELAGKFYLASGRQLVGQTYLREAVYLYGRWGAMGKVHQLAERYPFLTEINHFVAQPYRIASSLITTTGSRSTFSQLDMRTVIKASQTISSQIDLDGLLTTLMQLVVENAGAQRGCFFLFKNEQLFLEAEMDVGEKLRRVLQSVPLNEVGQAPIQMVQYVARTHDYVVLDDAYTDEQFKNVPYVAEKETKSILCAPLVNQNQLVGVLYLENNLAAGVFSPERVEVVKLLGTQAAISINNAHIFAVRAERERLRFENDMLARLNADKDKFFAIVSHDLRSPFNALLSGTDILLQILPKLSSEGIEERIQRIQKIARGAYDLLENLLTWSRLERGYMAYVPEVMRVRKITSSVLWLLKETAVVKQVSLSFIISATLTVYADRNMLHTILRNLISNALKFTSVGGKVMITAQATKQGMVRIEVRDTGIGMSETDVSKLFRLDVHHTTKGTAHEQGTGLGLILCRDMVARHNGRIGVESKLGQGTTVFVMLPLPEGVEVVAERAVEEVVVAGMPETKTAVVEGQPLTLPPLEILAQLRDLAMRGDMKALEQAATKLAAIEGVPYTAFAIQLQYLASNFEDDAIQKLLRYL